MKTIIDTLKYLLQTRYNQLDQEARQYIVNPYRREMEIIGKLQRKLDRFEKYITVVAPLICSLIVGFLLALWLSKLLLH